MEGGFQTLQDGEQLSGIGVLYTKRVGRLVR